MGFTGMRPRGPHGERCLPPAQPRPQPAPRSRSRRRCSGSRPSRVVADMLGSRLDPCADRDPALRDHPLQNGEGFFVGARHLPDRVGELPTASSRSGLDQVRRFCLRIVVSSCSVSKARRMPIAHSKPEPPPDRFHTHRGLKSVRQTATVTWRSVQTLGSRASRGPTTRRPSSRAICSSPASSAGSSSRPVARTSRRDGTRSRRSCTRRRAGREPRAVVSRARPIPD